MLIYITDQILRTFHFSFPLLRHGLPSYSFNFLVFFLLFVGCDCSLTDNLLFLILISGTETKVKIKLTRSSDYLEYQQKRKNVFCYESKVYVTHSLVFSSNKRKGKSLREVVLFYLKKKN